ncbi:MAG: GHKL domain-containing protein [Bacteroidales bacterium]|nr:GHKL domain-containing protein [Bacteroidales bacterium]
MQNLWRRISLLGIDKTIHKSYRHEIVLLNRINIIVLLLALLLLVLDIIGSSILDKVFDVGSLRLVLIIFISTIQLLLNSYQYFRLSKLSLVFTLPFLLIIFPTIFKKVSNEYFVWFPFVPVTLSIIPHLIFNYKLEKFYLFFSLTIYLVLTIFIDKIMLIHSVELPEIFPIIQKGYPYYKLASIVSFIFLNASLFYLFSENRKHETTLFFAHQNIDRKRLELKHKHAELNIKHEELLNKNRELEKVLAELSETQDKLIESEKMATLGTLTAGIAHDIVNPLNFISGIIQIITRDIELLGHQRGIRSDKASETLVKEMENIIIDANQGVERITGIISGLLTFSYEGKSEVTKNDVHNIIESSLLIIKSKLSHEITLKKSYHNIPDILCDEGKIYQVILNIIDNAIFAIKSKPVLNNEEIVIKTDLVESDNKKYVSVTIENTGPPIPDDVITKIFNPFYTTKRKGEGTGLGLSICNNIILEHKGILKVQNREDERVVFTILLPV